MNDDVFGALLGGLIVGNTAVVLFFAIFTHAGNILHPIGWDHIVCVYVDEKTEVGTRRTEHCVTGEQIAKWRAEQEKR